MSDHPVVVAPTALAARELIIASHAFAIVLKPIHYQ